MERQNIDVVWNNAVSNVGGMTNTFQNFQNISKEFQKLAKEAAYDEMEIRKKIIETYEATALWMVA
jgi:hypothetical protein